LKKTGQPAYQILPAQTCGLERHLWPDLQKQILGMHRRRKETASFPTSKQTKYINI